MLREVMMASYMSSMSSEVGVTCDMGKDGRSQMDIGNGWVEHTRPDGKRFYVNDGTGKRTWTRPKDALPEEDFKRCEGFVTKMKYEGRYPRGIETQATDGYDCQAFLGQLYDINEKKWEDQTAALKSKAASEGVEFSPASAEASLQAARENYAPPQARIRSPSSG